MSDTNATGTECPSCGEVAVSFGDEVETFPYGAGADRIELKATVPVGRCSACGFVFTDNRAEELRQAAVCDHLGLLKPKEIATLRKSYGVSRQDFCEVSKIGEASLSRWERGVGIQNAALDQLLYLLSFRENFVRLRARAPRAELFSMSSGTDNKVAVTIQFPHLKDTKRAKSDADNFRLRKEA